MDSKPHRDNILHPLYREMGVGIATNKGNLLLVIDFGTQPNVLPFFINQYDNETRTPNVMLTLSSEDGMPAGDGANIMGTATQVQISNGLDFTGATWQPFAKQIQWTLTAGDGLKTVYVKYRDARGRTATANDSITLNPSGDTSARAPAAAPAQQKTSVDVGTLTPTITRTATRAITPTQTRIILGSPTATISPTVTPSPELTATPTVTPTRVPTSSPTIVATTAASVESNVDGLLIIAGGFGLLLGALGLARFLAERSSLDN
jgi:hypothetical protein